MFRSKKPRLAFTFEGSSERYTKPQREALAGDVEHHVRAVVQASDDELRYPKKLEVAFVDAEQLGGGVAASRSLSDEVLIGVEYGKYPGHQRLGVVAHELFHVAVRHTPTGTKLRGVWGAAIEEGNAEHVSYQICERLGHAKYGEERRIALHLDDARLVRKTVEIVGTVDRNLPEVTFMQRIFEQDVAYGIGQVERLAARDDIRNGNPIYTAGTFAVGHAMEGHSIDAFGAMRLDQMGIVLAAERAVGRSIS